MFVLNRGIKLRLGMDNQTIMITVGEGSERCEYSFENSKLVSWIFNFRTLQTKSAILESGIKTLGYEIDEINTFISYLIEIKVLVGLGDEVNKPSFYEKQWEQWAWRDALDFHRATRNLTWRHDYSNNPEIMTWYYNDQFMDHSVPKPISAKKNSLASFILPDLTNRLFNNTIDVVLLNRRTNRRFIKKQLPLTDLSDILGYSFQNIGKKEGKNYHLAHTYSLGNFFEAYVVACNVENVDSGVYQYDKENHSISLLKAGDYSRQLIDYSNKQAYLHNVSIAIYLTTNWSQYMWKFRYSRAYRLALIELSGLAQNVLLCCTAINLKAFITPAIDEGKVIDLLGIKSNLEESPFYILGIGFN